MIHVFFSDAQMICKTEVSSEYLTIVPADIRKVFSINSGDILEWMPDDNKIIVKLRKKIQFGDIVGLIEEGGDALSAKKRIQGGI